MTMSRNKLWSTLAVLALVALAALLVAANDEQQGGDHAAAAADDTAAAAAVEHHDAAPAAAAAAAAEAEDNTNVASIPSSQSTELQVDRQLQLKLNGGNEIEIDQDQARNYVELGWQIRDTLGNRIKSHQSIAVDYTLDRRMRNGEVGSYEVVYIASDESGEVARNSRIIVVTDIDECDPERPRHQCSPYATCHNIPNSYECKCNDGYQGDGFVCVDIDECDPENPTHQCSPNAKCHNTEGSYECECLPGFRNTGKGYLVDGADECVDIDECAEGTHDCSVDGICHNTVGYFECTCKPGFEGDGRSCSPENKCEGFKNDCHQNAYCIPDEVGGYTCRCRTGYEDVGEVDESTRGRNCVDIDECATGAATCPEHSTCRNTDGSFECDCNAGFERQGALCIDIDECATGKDDCAPREVAICTNTIGSYTCKCKEGYEGDGRECRDTSKPTLMLRGDNPLRLELFDPFPEPGYNINEPTNHPEEVRLQVQVPPQLDTYALACGDYSVSYTLYEYRDGKKTEIDFVTRSVTVMRRDLCTFDRSSDPELLQLIPYCDKFAKCVELECGYDCVCYEGYEKIDGKCVDRKPPVIELQPEQDPYVLYECRVCHITETIDRTKPITLGEGILAYDVLPDGSREPAKLELESVDLDPVDNKRAVHHYKATDLAGNIYRRAVAIEVRSEDVREKIAKVEQMWNFLNENFAEFREKVDADQRSTSRIATITSYIVGTIALVLFVQFAFLVGTKTTLLIKVLSADRPAWSDFEEAWSFWLRVFHPLWPSADITAEVFRKWTEKSQ